MKTQDELYQELIANVEPILKEQQDAVKPLEDEFAEFVKPHQAVYEEQVAPFVAEIDKVYKPMKEAADKLALKYKVQYNLRVEKIVTGLMREQKRLQKRFDKATVEFKKQLDDAVAERKAAHDAAVLAIVKVAEEKIKPFNESYQEQAKLLDEATKAE